MADRKKTPTPKKTGIGFESHPVEKLVSPAGATRDQTGDQTPDQTPGQTADQAADQKTDQPSSPAVPRAKAAARKSSRATPGGKKPTSTGRPAQSSAGTASRATGGKRAGGSLLKSSGSSSRPERKSDSSRSLSKSRTPVTPEDDAAASSESPIISTLDRAGDATETVVERISSVAAGSSAAASERVEEAAQATTDFVGVMGVLEPGTAATQAQRVPGDFGDKFSNLSDLDLHLFNEGTHHRLHDKLGAHPMNVNGVDGTHFAVWAPAARLVSVIGDFNRWDKSANQLHIRGMSGIWEAFMAGVTRGALYKFHIESRSGYSVSKADPFGFLHESAPKSASIVWKFEHDWADQKWMKNRARRNSITAPQSIYEVHLGSWRRGSDGKSLSYREIAPRLAEYVKQMGFTHVEFMPLMEHPFYGSWGYQVTGFFASTSRYGSPDDLMYLVDLLHQNDIGVILDWVPSHFPSDEFGLSYFDGTHLFEHEDPREGFHPDWGSLIFNYGRHEVRSFLLSSAIYWLEQFHADGLRVDAVASMLYRDYSRKQGEWIPNKFGGRENLEAIDFLRTLNQDIYAVAPDVQTVAEESTSFPLVSRPTYVGGLGFGMKWDMGWMHDTLEYMGNDPIHRKFHHNLLTFRMMYAFSENFVLPLSHDEVVHLKGSLIAKMPGDDWQKFANLRLLFAYMFAQPGKKLMFMGGEFGQWGEWNHDRSLDWELLDFAPHAGLQKFVANLNRFYRQIPAMYAGDSDPAGFEWIDCNDAEHSVVSLMRKPLDGSSPVVAVFNFTPIPRYNYQIGVDHSGWWEEILNSDGAEFGGSGVGNLGRVESAPVWKHGRRYALNLTLPPLGAVFLMLEKIENKEESGLELAESWKAVVAEKPAAKSNMGHRSRKSVQ